MRGIVNRRRALCGLAAALMPRLAWAEAQVGRFMLEDVDGAVVDDAALRGRFSLVFFGYTLCPDLCPTALLTVSNVLALLGPDAGRILPLFVSLDPDRDSRRQLSDYAANFDPRIVALRGPKPYVEAAARAFDVTYRMVTPDPAKPADYTVDHTAAIILVAPDGTIARRFGYDRPAAEIAAELRRLMAAAPAAAGN